MERGAAWRGMQSCKEGCMGYNQECWGGQGGMWRCRVECSRAGTHLVCGDLERRVAQVDQEGQGDPAAPRIRYQGDPEVLEALVAQQYCPPWDPRQCERTSVGAKPPGMPPPTVPPLHSPPYEVLTGSPGYPWGPGGPGSPETPGL